jgi:hypothetical protein
MLKKKTLVSLLLATTVITATAASAAEISIEAVMAPKESIKMNFEDGSKHFVLMVHRAGTAKGSGEFADANVNEYGFHDINPPIGADPHGYLQFKTKNGDIANIKWNVRAVFFKGEKKPRLVDYGYWELVSGTGQFESMTGVGTLTIKPASETDRLFTLKGELGPRP